MIRVLQVLGKLNLGGAESRIMDLYRHMDRDKIQFDFLIHYKEKGFFEDEIRQLGGEIYYLPSFRIYNFFSYRKACRRFFEEHSYFAAVHGHMTSTAAIYLPEAKRAGIPLTIAHARSAGVDKGLKGMLTRVLRKKLYTKCDRMFACSDLAAESVFGKKRYEEGRVTIMPNAIDTMEFRPRGQVREEIRKKCKIDDKFVIGHVGRFHYAKNHEFLMDVFVEITKQKENAVLMLLGDGPLLDETKQKAKQLGVSDKVLFMGNCSPVAPYYQAFDCFLFPSRFEGMPGTVVEAQAAEITCLISDSITKQVKATDLVHFYPLKKTAKEWADEVLYLVEHGKESDKGYDLSVTNYDIHNQVTYYTELYNGYKK